MPLIASRRFPSDDSGSTSRPEPRTGPAQLGSRSPSGPCGQVDHRELALRFDFRAVGPRITQIHAEPRVAVTTAECSCQPLRYPHAGSAETNNIAGPVANCTSPITAWTSTYRVDTRLILTWWSAAES